MKASRDEPALSQPYPLPKTYDSNIEEPKWQKLWMDRGIFRFDPLDVTRPTYSIDTPPPYPSGEFHVGNALNWCYLDFVARYQRMRGRNVHFPQGWDCHGLPTEVNAEKTFKIRKNDVPPSEFVKMCRKLTTETIDSMKHTIISLGVSTDWNLEYRTMDPEYYKLTQISFLRLYKSGHMYRGEHPVNWCPRCETAIAEAEVERIDRRGVLYHMRFGEPDETIVIASTRPELLCACVAVAVHPDDPRYHQRIGKKTLVPIFGQKVPIISDPEVDPAFGTGAVMVCTFGDKTDVRWQKKYKLPLIRSVTENGRLTPSAGKFQGLKMEEARRQIAQDLQTADRISKTEQTTQSIGTCWRCKTPVEIISRPQWFMKTRDMTEEVVAWAGKLRWVPPFARQRLVDWARSLDWDWVVSRQRIFATPIPIWYCSKCGETITPSEETLPVDPRIDSSPIKSCPSCKSTELKGETDVLDTWMDSSITTAVHAGWPTNHDLFKRLFPADLQPNGLDIVRTWDYYLLVRSLALFRTAPYKTLMINGMVRGTDGRMMHKSYGNYVETDEVLQKFGADALRQWAAGGGSTGYDIPFRWTEIEHGRKFLTKLWNVARFILGNLTPSVRQSNTGDLSLIDKWMLSSAQKLISDVTDAFENFQFSAALEAIREFAWHTLADNYLEAVKHRLQPETDIASREAAQYCLYEALLTVCKLLAPICPHITESIYQQTPREDKPESLHRNRWPKANPELALEEWITEGFVLVETIAVGRRRKAEKGLSLKSPLKALVIAGSRENLALLRENEETITRTLKAESLQLRENSEQDSSQSGAPVRVEIVA